MSHETVYKNFIKIFPMYSSRVSKWFQNGRNSIRIRLLDTPYDFVFTYKRDDLWRFETVKSHISEIHKNLELRKEVAR